MLGLGWEELLILLVIGVIFIGPKQLPALMRGMGKVFKELRAARDQWSRAIREDEGLREIQRSIHEVSSQVHRPLEEIRKQVRTEIEKIEEQTETLRQPLDSETLGDVLDDKTEIYVRDKKDLE